MEAPKPLALPLQGILQRLKSMEGVTAEPGDDGWFFLTAPGMSALILFDKLRRDWSNIVGSELMKFALIYSKSGPNAGVWLHYLGTPAIRGEYEHGIHEIPWA
jgi:hypothetical protein